MNPKMISTDNAPKSIGPYSQAVRSGKTVFLSGQIPLDPATGQLFEGDIAAQSRRVFDNLQAVCQAAGGSLDCFSPNAVALYNAFLRRGGDLGGVQFWIGQLATRTREAIRVEFKNSTEFQARVNAIIAQGCL